jgi:predicted RNA-binding Zn ribbon-like protein
MNNDLFDMDAGALCLDFANTVEWHASDQPKDLLGDATHLIAWGEAANILSSERAEALRQVAEDQPTRAAAELHDALQFRESIYGIFSAYATGRAVEAADLSSLNDALGTAMSHLHLVSSSQGFEWDWRDQGEGVDGLLWAVARSAGELLTSSKLERVSQCQDDRGCGYLFIDTSRNKSRRWCSMESCGNRAKARRHYQRQKA